MLYWMTLTEEIKDLAACVDDRYRSSLRYMLAKLAEDPAHVIMNIGDELVGPQAERLHYRNILLHIARGKSAKAAVEEQIALLSRCVSDFMASDGGRNLASAVRWIICRQEYWVLETLQTLLDQEREES